MQLNLIKIFIIIFLIFYQTSSYSKKVDNINFNQKYLSDYFSALLAYDNQENIKTLKYFNLSKPLVREHDNFLKEYTFSLIINGKILEAIKQIKYWEGKENSNFFEAKVLLLIDSLINKNYSKSSKYLFDLRSFQRKDTYQLIIFETLKSYTYLFEKKKIEKENNGNFGRLSLITESFQNCYLDTKEKNLHFFNLINSEKAEGDYSRYLFFYISNLIEYNNYSSAINITNEIDPISSGLLVSQTKDWIEKANYTKFKEVFSCKNESHLLAEFFYLISNLYSSQKNYEKSNFFLHISNYLNPKFYFNLSLLIENHYLADNYDLAKNLLKKFKKNEEVYYWYRIKKEAQIIGKKKNKKKSLNFIEKEFQTLNKSNPRIIFDMATIYKGFENYYKAIDLYSTLLPSLENNLDSYADVLYRRGSCYERIGNYKNSDKDLLKSLEIIPNDPYVMNYLGYNWLERNHKIYEAIEMLDKAYKQKKDDPYIIDSVGWGYYLIGDFKNAERFLKKAVQLMPYDPIVNDHYGDILWMLNKKIQAKYFWQSVLNLDTTEEQMKKNIKKKLLIGIEKI